MSTNRQPPTLTIRDQMMNNFAEVLAALRAGEGLDPWDPAGILAALRTAWSMGEPADVLHAAINATIDPTNRTPAIIAMRGPHWSATTTTPRDTRPPRYEPEPVRRDPAAAAAAADCLAKVRAELEGSHRHPNTPKETP